MATIGITDSGTGGLTVLKALYKMNDRHRYIYLADTLGAPYGLKPQKKIIEMTRYCTDSLIKSGADIIVIACNTATSAAIENLRGIYDIEIVGTEPAVMPAIKDKHKKILILATPYTIRSERYIKLVEKYEDIIISCPCRDLAGLIDENAPDFDNLFDYAESILKPFRDSTAVVFGCTHYVLIKDIIKKIMPHAELYDSSDGIARRVNHLINKYNLQVEKEGELIFERTDGNDAETYRKLFNAIYLRG